MPNLPTQAVTHIIDNAPQQAIDQIEGHVNLSNWDNTPIQTDEINFSSAPMDMNYTPLAIGVQLNSDATFANPAAAYDPSLCGTDIICQATILQEYANAVNDSDLVFNAGANAAGPTEYVQPGARAEVAVVNTPFALAGNIDPTKLAYTHNGYDAAILTNETLVVHDTATNTYYAVGDAHNITVVGQSIPDFTFHSAAYHIGVA